MLFGVLLAHPFSQATSSPPGDKREYILVINTYTESDPWSYRIISDITARIEQVENTEIYTEYMNMLLINTQASIDEFMQNLVRTYGKNPPRMLILIGSSSYVLRDFPQKAWGGVLRPSSARNRISSGLTNITSQSGRFPNRNGFPSAAWPKSGT